MKNSLLKKILSLVKRRKTDYDFNTMVSSFISFSFTILFALYNCFLGIYSLSIWHGSICIFYLFLVAIRGMILLEEKNSATESNYKTKVRQLRVFIISSFLLLILNIALIVPISLMVKLEKPTNMGLIPAIAMAAYTTYKFTIAFIHIQKQKHRNINLLIVELRTISFIDALVSILTLQNTLIMVNYEKSEPYDMMILSAFSSAAIYIIILTTTISLLIKGLLSKRKAEPNK